MTSILIENECRRLSVRLSRLNDLTSEIVGWPERIVATRHEDQLGDGQFDWNSCALVCLDVVGETFLEK
ncbi:hypothetical protein ASF91_22240 [Rhizobium sp. Leaf155]|jgi:hypothetical protein|nr:hypothetical protein ASF91_22240 [Rhizobium sp. Leaf155]